MTRPRPLKYLFDSGIAHQLLEHAHHLQRLTTNINACLDPETASHTQVAAEHAQSLVLLADSAAWATRLRYQCPQLLRCLARYSHLKHLQRIEVKVAPISTATTAPTQPAQALSRASADLIEAHAESIQHHPLRAALMRLAQRGKK